MAQANKGIFRFRELSRAEIGDNLWLIVSARSDGKIVVARGNMVQSEGREKMVFMADPLVLKNTEALGSAGNALLDAYDRLIKDLEDNKPVIAGK